MDDTKTVTNKVRDLYNSVPYYAYGENYFPVFKSLNLEEDKLKDKFQNSRMLEVGCGGGQLSVYLSNFFKHITAVDISQASLDAAKKVCEKQNILNVDFKLGDLFDAEFIQQNQNKYDYILCYGVLHHTADPKKGFTQLVQMLKPGGIITVGVYSRTEILYRIKRKMVLLLSGDNLPKREVWAKKLFFKNQEGFKRQIYDGYVHPQVSFHSITEVCEWVTDSDLKYIGSWPPVEIGWYINKFFGKILHLKQKLNFKVIKSLFWLVELLWILSGKSVMVSVSAVKK